MEHVVTRFAPSPTGFLHIGGVRTALFAFLWARKHSGTFILRIEDTDQKRKVPGSLEHIQESLRWLGIDWDYGPDKPGPFGSCIQSERLSAYHKAAEELVAKGHAYPDPYTEDELSRFRAQAEAEKRPFLFRIHRPESFEPWDGKKALRFKVPEIKRYQWDDVVRGHLDAGEEALDDFILLKSDGFPTYNFAHIVDDHAMGITHVLRADEFISSTPRYLSVYDAMGIPPPLLATLPPILNDDRTKKLGKRDGAKDILEYRTEGYLPEAMANFLALIGWNPGGEQEIYSMSELMHAFNLSKVQRSGGACNLDKLDWMNKQYLKMMSPEKFAEVIASYFRGWDSALVARVAPIVLEHITKLSDIDAGEFGYFATRPDYSKQLLKNIVYLPRVRELLAEVPTSNFQLPTIKSTLWDFATEKGRGEVLWPLRVALTGRERSADPFTVAAVLGKEETLHRIDHALAL